MQANRRKEQTFNGVRQRSTKKDKLLDDSGFSEAVDDYPYRPRAVTSVPPSVVSLVLIFFIGIFCVQLYMENYQLPEPLLITDIPKHPNRFIAERSMIRLLKLTSLGPRVSGSSSEVKAVQVLKSEVEEIISRADKSKTVELDIQRVSGAFPLRFLDGMTNVYRNVNNVVVRLSSRKNWKHSLLINCHFDTVADSPGGSDDGASCANMLEILEVLATSSQPLSHNIIFLFNGAEENLMQAAHGFITQHRWAPEVRAFVNLEACGAGGREVLFQSGPKSPWILETYANTVPRPYASSMAQEIFESGIVPGDTDFRVFRDFGNVSGLDFAWSTNGYVYHTRFDDADQIPLGTLQRTGENILELVRGLATAPELEDPEKHRPGNLVYFDILGLVVVRWSETVANVLNVAAVLLSICAIILSRSAFKREHSNGQYSRELVKTLAVVVGGMIACSAVCLTTATFLGAIGRTMSWYGRPAWLFFLYVIPCITTIMSVHFYASKWQLKTVRSRSTLVEIYLDVYQIIWTVALLVGIWFQIRSACLAWLWVISPVLANFVHRYFRFNKVAGRGWLVVFLIGMVGPVVQFSGMQVGILSLFVPILGRVGAAMNPDIVVGIYCTYTFAMLFSYASPLILLEKNPKRLLTVLAGVSIASLLVVSTTSLSFPYSSDAAAPKPQRYMMVHTERIYYNYSRQETDRQTGYWIISMDYNTPTSMIPYVPEVRKAEQVQDCETQLYCGVPYLMPALSLISKTHWIPGPPPKMAVPQELKLFAKEYHHDNRTMRLSFRASGPDHMGLMISPRPGVTLRGWSISAESPVPGPKWQGRKTYFVYYANALGSEPWTFHIDLDPKYLKKPMVDIALTGHHLHGPHQRSPGFQQMLDQFPSWTALMAWTASYKSYVF